MYEVNLVKKQSREVTVGIGLIIISLSIGVLFAKNIYDNRTFKSVNNVTPKEQSYTIQTKAKEYKPESLVVFNTQTDIKETETEEVITEPKEEVAEKQEEIKNEKVEDTKEEVKEEIKKVVYDGLTLEELITKLDRNLNSTLSGMGHVYANYSLELGVDPYLALAISLHETGCKWTCSKLVRECNNVGGQKGSPSCNGGSYKKYDTIEEGIKGYIDNIKKNYYDYGLTTPETMNSKYAADPEWSTKVNKYINDIKAN